MSRVDSGGATSGRWAVPAAVLSGLLLAAAFPLADQGWLAFIALVPLIRAVRGGAPRRAARLGFVSGAIFFAALLYWLVGVMTRYGGLPAWAGAGFLLLLVAYLALYVAAFAALVAAVAGRFGAPGLLAAPIVWVGLEFVRGHLLTGFPWGLLGYTQWRNTPFLQIAATGGVHAVSFLVVLANAALALLLERGAPARARLLGAGACGLVVAAQAVGTAVVPPLSALPTTAIAAATAAGAPGGEEAPSVAFAVAAIQANVAQDRKWNRAEEGAIIAGLFDMTASAATAGARVVVWPESSSPLSFRVPASRAAGGAVEHRIEPRRDYLDAVAALVRDRRLTLIAGSVDYRWDGERLLAFNSAMVVDEQGVLGPSYDKIRLVPFGEYVPLRHVLFFVDRMVQGAIAEFAPGTRPEPLPTPFGPAATFVCYEAIFPGLVRDLARDAAFMVNITNDAWFGGSAAPRQHLAMAALRAAENRRWLVRAANTGISAIVDPWGRVRAEAPLDVRTVLQGTIEARSRRSPFARAGDVAGIACAILTVLFAAAHRAAFLRPGL
jgi:apolipoprotein N-acyltransferase